MDKNKIHVEDTIEQLRPSLKPPVSNKMLFNGKLKVMVVGGPNQRKDFHIEMGEELFYQYQGDMNLIIMDPVSGRPRDIVIREGEVFLLPAGIAHSPQRFADTIGIVFERDRAVHEADCLLWYKDDCSVLYEEFLHCQDLGTQIKEAIERFNKHMEDGRPFEPAPEGDPSVLALRACMASTTQACLASPLRMPFSLSAFLADHASSPAAVLCDSEFVFRAYRGALSQRLPISWREAYLWMHAGTATVTRGSDVLRLDAGEAVLLRSEDGDGEAWLEVQGHGPDAVLLLVASSSPHA